MLPRPPAPTTAGARPFTSATTPVRTAPTFRVTTAGPAVDQVAPRACSPGRSGKNSPPALSSLADQREHPCRRPPFTLASAALLGYPLRLYLGHARRVDRQLQPGHLYPVAGCFPRSSRRAGPGGAALGLPVRVAALVGPQKQFTRQNTKVQCNPSSTVEETPPASYRVNYLPVCYYRASLMTLRAIRMDC